MKYFTDDEFKCNDFPCNICYNSSNELSKDIQCGNQSVDIIENILYQWMVK